MWTICGFLSSNWVRRQSGRCWIDDTWSVVLERLTLHSRASRNHVLRMLWKFLREINPAFFPHTPQIHQIVVEWPLRSTFSASMYISSSLFSLSLSSCSRYWDHLNSIENLRCACLVILCQALLPSSLFYKTYSADRHSCADVEMTLTVTYVSCKSSWMSLEIPDL